MGLLSLSLSPNGNQKLRQQDQNIWMKEKQEEEEEKWNQWRRRSEMMMMFIGVQT